MSEERKENMRTISLNIESIKRWKVYKKSQTESLELKNTTTEIKKFCSRFELAKDRNSELENTFTQSMEKKVKIMKKNEQSFRELWKTIEYINIGLLGV